MKNSRSEPLTSARRWEIAARAKAATPGPWAWANTCEKGYGANVGAGCFAEDDEHCDHPLSGDLTHRADDYYVDEPIAGLDHQKAATDANFIAAARQDVPDLLAALEQAERERDLLAETARRLAGEREAAVADAERWRLNMREVVDCWYDTVTDSMEYSDLLDTMDARLNEHLAARTAARGED